MKYRYNKNNMFMYFSFLITALIYIIFLILNNKEYKEGVKFQEEFLGKKIYSNVAIQSSAIEERINHEIENIKFIKESILNKGYKRAETEILLNQEMESLKEFLSAIVIYKSEEKEIAVYHEERAVKMAETVYIESKRKDRGIYISDFNLNSKSQYIGIAVKVDENITLTAVYNFRYISEKFIEKGGSGNYISYSMLDKYGNIIFDYEREKIGGNLFVINSENEILKKNIKEIIEKDGGINEYRNENKDKKLKILTAWKSFEIENKKIIIYGSASEKEIEKVISKLKLQNRYNFYIASLLFISICITIYLYFKRGNECKINTVIKDERDNLEFMINESKSIFWEYYPEEKKIYFSEKFYEITGYNKENLKNDIEEVNKIGNANDLKNLKEVIKEAENNKTGEFSFEIRVKKLTGKYIWFLSRGKVVKSEKNKIIKIIGFLTEITEIKQKEGELLSFKTAVEQSPVTIVFTDTEGKITFVNEKFKTLTGYTKEEAMGKNPRILKSERHDTEFYRNMWDTLLAGAVWSGEVINRKKNGEIYYERANIAPITDENKRTVGYVAIKEDITRQKEIDIKMEKFATRDELTGVLNRRAGLEFLEQQIKISDRNKEKFSIIYVDVNSLKYVNDNLGHSHGDSLIVEVCGEIKEEIRSSDIIARIGGDEFIVVMPDCDKKEADIIWRRVVKSFEYLNKNFKRAYNISVSHGVYEYITESNANVDMILETADREMYIEKKRIKAGKSEENNV